VILEKQRVLVVDDHPANRLAFQLVLEQDYDVHLAESGRQAIELAQREEFAVILLDVRMPDMDGIETATKLRRLGRTTYTSIIFTSAVDKPQSHVNQGFSEGATDYLLSPVDPEFLKLKVATHSQMYLRNEATARKRTELLAQGHEAMARTLRSMSVDSPIEEVLRQVFKASGDILGAHSAAVYRLDDDGDAPQEREAGLIIPGHLGSLNSRRAWEEYSGKGAVPIHLNSTTPAAVPEDILVWGRREGYRTLLVAPLRWGTGLIGSLCYGFQESRSFDVELLELAQSLANQAALALRLATLAEENSRSTLLVERSRMAAEMHDTIAQGLSVVILQLDMGLRMASAEGKIYLEGAAKVARETLSQARRAVWNLRSEVSDDRDLSRSLGRLAGAMADGGACVAVKIDGIVPILPYETASNLFQIAREAVANSLRHAKARFVKVILTVRTSELLLDLIDDGCGFEVLPKAVRRGFGLGIMEQRAEKVGGKFSIVSSPGGGTHIAVTVPLARTS
jgi:signal transduction histidine kinase